MFYSYDMPTSDFQVIHHFQNGVDGSSPEGALTVGTDGKIYGTTTQGGTNNSGVIYCVDPNTDFFSALFQMDEVPTGSYIYGGLTQHSNGLFYGTTLQGGATGDGTLFSFNSTTNALTNLVDFDILSTGSSPYS